MTQAVVNSLQNPDHSPRSVEPSAAMSQGDLAELIGAFNDVTVRLQSSHEALRQEVVRLQAELREANSQLERSRRLAALGEMAAGIAHEVRNPLGSIRLYGRMLESDLEAYPAARELAAKIGGAVRSVDAVVSDVLTFAKEMRATIERVDLDDLISRAVEDVINTDRAGRGGAAGASRRPVQVRRLDRVSGPKELACDPSLAARAISNVVSNAIEAMRESEASANDLIPVLTLAVREHVHGGREGSGAVVVMVQDNGPGFPPGVIERMFNPFFTTRATGTGLGLAIVHRIMDAHGGQVVARNAGEAADRGSRSGVARERRGRRGAVVELWFPKKYLAALTPEDGKIEPGTGATDGLDNAGRTDGAGSERVREYAA